jgi:multiple sugar transport system permease protein
MTATAQPVTKTLVTSSIRAKKRSTRILTYFILIALGVVFMFPWFWSVGTSLKTSQELYIYPPPFVPATPQFGNYPEVFNLIPFWNWIKNSLIVVALSTIGSVASAILVAYAFARFRWRGRDLIFGVTLATMMLPAEVTLIPQYLLFKYLTWLDTIKPLWVPAWFGGGAYAIFLIRQFIMSLPREFDEAATIDGANPITVLTMILAPLMKPVIATIAVMNFIWAWNDFMGPLIYLATPRKFTLALGLRYFDTARPGQSWGIPQDHYMMAAVVMSTTPVILLFFAAQRYFVQGIVMSGIKG